MNAPDDAGTYRYVGEELDLFALAHNWRAYWFSEIKPFLGGHILEVGSGIGSNAPLLGRASRRLTCLEPDPAQGRRLRQGIEEAGLGDHAEVRTGGTSSLGADQVFDAILYIDVLEHIEHDHAELARAARFLREGGHLIVLSPAFPQLFTPFDKAIGHYRRYTRKSLSRLAGPDWETVKLRYLDALGFCSSCANKLFLKQAMPKASQLRFWDQRLVPLSRRIDPLIFHVVGKSVLGIWRKPADGEARAPDHA
jgi:ubiquinone/menaquinone biosynthesis C-methylase UbiE